MSRRWVMKNVAFAHERETAISWVILTGRLAWVGGDGVT